MVIRFDHPVKKFAFLVSLLTVSVCVGWQSLKVFVASQYAEHVKGVVDYDRAITWDEANSDYHYYQGRLYHYAIDAIDPERAISCYRRALQLNPLVGKYWLDLGKAYEEKKAWADAEQAFGMAVQLNARSPQVCWQAANFWLRRGNLDQAFANLKTAAEGDDMKLDAAINIAWKVTADRAKILKEAIPDTLRANLRFLNFALSKKDYAIAVRAWERVLANTDTGFEVNQMFTYVDALLNESQIQQAVQVWNQAVAKCGLRDRVSTPSAEASLIQNGSFEKEFLNGGFDWRVLRSHAFSLATDVQDRMEGYRSLRIEFTGKENIDFRHLFQIVPVMVGPLPALSRTASPRMVQGQTGDRLRQAVSFVKTVDRRVPASHDGSTSGSRNLVFRYFIKTKDLSTDQGVFWEIVDYPGQKGLQVRSALYSGTTPWSQGQMAFHVGEEVPSILIRLRRLPSQKFDNLLKGTIWVDGIKLNVE